MPIQHPPIRASTRQLSKKNRIVPYLFSTDAFYFLLAALTEEIEADAVFLRLNNLVKAISQLGILGIG